MSQRNWRPSRFTVQADEPLGPLANLIDIMLVFTCGLIAALFALSPELVRELSRDTIIEEGRELPDVPEGIREGGSGLKPVGQVYRDPETGKLILISADSSDSSDSE